MDATQKKIKQNLEDIIDYADTALAYVSTIDDDYAFVANINSIIEELGEIANLAQSRKNIRARIGASALEFKPYHGWEDD